MCLTSFDVQTTSWKKNIRFSEFRIKDCEPGSQYKCDADFGKASLTFLCFSLDELLVTPSDLTIFDNSYECHVSSSLEAAAVT